MKKLFGKLPVMIAMWVVSVALLVITIVMAVRPVSYGWAYKCDEQDVLGYGEDQEITIIFEDERELEMKIELEGLYFEMNMWYLRESDEYIAVGISQMPPLVEDAMGAEVLTAKEFEERVDYYKEDRNVWRKLWSTAERVNAFKCEFNGEEFVCGGAIAFTVVFSILSAIGLAASTVSTVLFVKGRKKEVVSVNSQPNLPAQEELPQETNKVEGQIEIDGIQE